MARKRGSSSAPDLFENSATEEQVHVWLEYANISTASLHDWEKQVQGEPHASCTFLPSLQDFQALQQVDQGDLCNDDIKRPVSTFSYECDGMENFFRQHAVF
ncbi:MAG: hypothetical protein FDX30_08330 [Chlorobium sp.]|nr:MAG: hypothetical protein FDX30_08330 [Chlorobium sp.]